MTHALETIFRAVRILDESSISVAGEPPVPISAPSFRSPQIGAVPSAATPLVAALTERLYTRCYVRPLESPLPADSRAHPAEEDPQFAGALSRANRSRDHWDSGWLVLSLEPTGRVHVQKGERIRSALPGQYVVTTPAGGMPQPGSLVDLWALGGTHQFQPGFFFAFGETLGHEADEYDTVRIYFNVTADAAPVLTEKLTGELNHLCVPFRLKCMNHPADYVRTDAVVAYIALRYFQITAQIISHLPESLTAKFDREVPLFSKKLALGIGIAEDPRGGESFGQHRCRLVAEGLIDAWREGRQDPSYRLQCVERRFQLGGLDLQRPYLNPGSVDLYTLPTNSGIVL